MTRKDKLRPEVKTVTKAEGQTRDRATHRPAPESCPRTPAGSGGNEPWPMQGQRDPATAASRVRFSLKMQTLIAHALGSLRKGEVRLTRPSVMRQ